MGVVEAGDDVVLAFTKVPPERWHVPLRALLCTRQQ